MSTPDRPGQDRSVPDVTTPRSRLGRLAHIRSAAAPAAPVVGVGAAMAFTAAIAATWIEQPATRTVGDVAVSETGTTAGMELVPLGVVVGLLAVVCAVALLATRGVARRVAASLLAFAGAGALVAAAVGSARLGALDGRLTAGPFVAVLAAVVIVAAGLLGLGPAPRRMPARYDVDVDPEDREWHLATDAGDAQGEDRPAS